MTIAQQVFLYAAEEKSITKAAKKAFITQQCASSHIKNLEKQYGTLLFTRKPVFALTPAGEYLLSSLYRLNILEREIDDGMKEIGSGMSGILRLGINPTRARILIPSILLQCKALIPGLQLSVCFGDRDFLMKQLSQGAIDMLIAAGPVSPAGKQFCSTPLAVDQIHFITTRNQIARYNPILFQKNAAHEPLSLADIQNFPLCRSALGSTVTELIHRLALQQNLTLNDYCYISDYDVQLSLCSDGLTSMFCPTLILDRILTHNQTAPSEQQLLFFHLSDIHEEIRMDLFQNHTPYEPPYVKMFIQILKQTTSTLYENIQNVFPA